MSFYPKVTTDSEFDGGGDGGGCDSFRANSFAAFHDENGHTKIATTMKLSAADLAFKPSG